jgi:tetratricopeptide (TPR) repeat protein
MGREMSDNADKARTIRLERLRAMVDKHLDHAPAAVEALMSELKIGEAQPELWEQLHAAAVRDDQELELAEAYRKIAVDRRLKQLPPSVRTDLLMHAADFSQGALGDWDGAEGYLRNVLEIAPDHTEAFARLERHFEAAGDKLELIELYATVAATPPKPPEDLARRAVNEIAQFAAKVRLSDEACKRLMVFMPASTAILGVLDAHCQKTGRAVLACALIEEAIEKHGLSDARVLEQRRRLIELYMGDAAAPEKAISHIEDLLRRDPNDAQARDAGRHLLSNNAVATRAAEALQAARRKSQSPPA